MSVVGKTLGAVEYGLFQAGLRHAGNERNCLYAVALLSGCTGIHVQV